MKKQLVCLVGSIGAMMLVISFGTNAMLLVGNVLKPAPHDILMTLEIIGAALMFGAIATSALTEE